MPTKHLLIKGKVQGVFYRATCRDIAEHLGVTGWVKNTEEGNVEIVATGDAEQLGKLIEWCGHGPEKAVVTDVQVVDKEEESFARFTVIR